MATKCNGRIVTLMTGIPPSVITMRTQELFANLKVIQTGKRYNKMFKKIGRKQDKNDVGPFNINLRAVR